MHRLLKERLDGSALFRVLALMITYRLRNVSMEMRHRFDLISVEMQPPFGLNSRLQVD